jgi:hypothetical protein
MCLQVCLYQLCNSMKVFVQELAPSEQFPCVYNNRHQAKAWLLFGTEIKVSCYTDLLSSRLPIIYNNRVTLSTTMAKIT